MNDNQLKEAWQKLAIDKEKINFKSPNLRSNMEQEIKKFEKRIRLRNRKEIITAAGLLIFFVALAISSDGYQRIGSILLIGYFIWVIYYLTKANLQQPVFGISKSIKEQLIEYRSYVLLQRNLIKNVLYWYILPILPGIIFLWLSFESKVVVATSALISIFIFTYIYRLNQRAAKENYDYLLSQLNQAIQNLEV